MEKTKYEYYLHTWGGFYNEEYKRQHMMPKGEFWFDTASEREQFMDKLIAIERELDAHHLMMRVFEGYFCRVPVILHRVIEWSGVKLYSNHVMGVGFSMMDAKYHLEYKWQCGHGDYPLGTDFDYEENEVEVVQEWITGAFEQ